jgi:hypothetical protein
VETFFQEYGGPRADVLSVVFGSLHRPTKIESQLAVVSEMCVESEFGIMDFWAEVEAAAVAVQGGWNLTALVERRQIRRP